MDFDGTLAASDVGNALCDRFAPPREAARRWWDGELRLDEAQREIWGLVRGEPGVDELLADLRR